MGFGGSGFLRGSGWHPRSAPPQVQVMSFIRLSISVSISVLIHLMLKRERERERGRNGRPVRSATALC